MFSFFVRNMAVLFAISPLKYKIIYALICLFYSSAGHLNSNKISDTYPNIGSKTVVLWSNIMDVAFKMVGRPTELGKKLIALLEGSFNGY